VCVGGGGRGLLKEPGGTFAMHLAMLSAGLVQQRTGGQLRRKVEAAVREVVS
jgi:hypothetical protein